jgi:DNA-directed RNA polymerase subunit RPC12/RpoP
MVLECPVCGSDRVVPLTFETAVGELLAELPERPLAKCADCGHRLTAAEIAAQEKAKRG